MYTYMYVHVHPHVRSAAIYVGGGNVNVYGGYGYKIPYALSSQLHEICAIFLMLRHDSEKIRTALFISILNPNAPGL